MKNKDLDNIKHSLFNTIMQLFIELDASGKAIVKELVDELYHELINEEDEYMAKPSEIINNDNLQKLITGVKIPIKEVYNKMIISGHKLEMEKFLEVHLGLDYKIKFMDQCVSNFLDDILNDTDIELTMYKIKGFNCKKKILYTQLKNCSSIIDIPLSSLKMVAKNNDMFNFSKYYLAINNEEKNTIDYTNIIIENEEGL